MELKEIKDFFNGYGCEFLIKPNNNLTGDVFILSDEIDHNFDLHNAKNISFESIKTLDNHYQIKKNKFHYLNFFFVKRGSFNSCSLHSFINSKVENRMEFKTETEDNIYFCCDNEINLDKIYKKLKR